jgi:hypothetical protein
MMPGANPAGSIRIAATAPNCEHPDEQANPKGDSHRMVRVIPNRLVRRFGSGDSLFLEALIHGSGFGDGGLQTRAKFPRLFAPLTCSRLQYFLAFAHNVAQVAHCFLGISTF